MSTLHLPCGGEYCTALEEHEGLRVGDKITFHDAGRPETLSGTIRELYVEMHPNVIIRQPEGSDFAEVDLVDGGEARCWFRRDRPTPAREIDGVLGVTPEGAMF